MSDVKLCVNIDHIATVRQAMGIHYPDPIEGALLCEKSGAHGITVHLREDRRHIQDKDVYALKNVVTGKYNLEMALSDEIIAIARRVVPHQITLVPEKREELTTEGGLNVMHNFDRIRHVVELFHEIGVQVSLFIEPDLKSVEKSKESGADYIEIHTGTYCTAADALALEGEDPALRSVVDRELERIYQASERAVDIGIRVNAGHGLNYDNLRPVLSARGLEELNIGHSIIARAIFDGLHGAVQGMLRIIES